MIYKPFISLLYSRKFLLAAFAVVQTVILHYVDIDPEIWAAIDGLVLVLIATIAYEDAAEKGNEGSQTNLMTAGDSDVTVNQPDSKSGPRPDNTGDPEPVPDETAYYYTTRE